MIKVSIFILLGLLFAVPSAEAKESYVTVVNPVRSRIHWNNSRALDSQIQLILSKNIPATWLIQYSNLSDRQVIDIFKSLSSGQEMGLFLEVDEKLADDSLVPYLYGDGDWARPDKVFLSGYKPVERKRMIDRAFSEFRQIFGYFPKSVGAWYIDAVSLNYMVDKYAVTAVLDCSDQYQTDKYGLWGKPWGNPYFPSRLNPLLPAHDDKDKLRVVKIQWAQRDPALAYGLTVTDSTYSVQANDYISHPNLPTDYFVNLAGSYLFAGNETDQLTVGLEVGQEGYQFAGEMARQIDSLNSLKSGKGIIFTTMSQFADLFQKTNSDNSGYFIAGSDWYNPDNYAYWYSAPEYRVGLLLKNNKFIIRDLRDYSLMQIFTDITAKDGSKELKRFLTGCIDELIMHNTIVIAERVKDIIITRSQNAVEMQLSSADGQTKKLILNKNNIILQDKEIFSTSDKNNIINKLSYYLSTSVLDYILRESRDFQPALRFTSLDGISYWGITLKPTRFIGFYSRIPFIASFDFPFQVLSRFTHVPRFEFLTTIMNLVNIRGQCKIKL